MTVVQATRRLTIDAGHRVPGHGGKCRSPHGHTYTFEVTVEGDVPEDGMVLDFGVLKDAMVACIDQPWDHAFLAWREDELMAEALAADDTWKAAWLPLPPTAENLAILAGRALAAVLDDGALRVVSVRVWETPNCYATWEAAR